MPRPVSYFDGTQTWLSAQNLRNFVLTALVQRVLSVTILTIVLSLAAGMPATAQAPGPAANLSALDELARETAVHAAAAALRDRYIYPMKGKDAAAKIEANLASGAYAGVADRIAFADRLTSDLAEVAHDKHLRVMAAGGPPPPAIMKMGPLPRSDFGVVRSDRLSGGIGYVEISEFPPPEVFKPAAVRAMAPLAGCKAIIVDMRRNRGGRPESVAYFASFFFDDAKPVHLNDLIWRNPATDTFHTEAFYTTSTPTKFIGVPVYVLISAGTFSGGEEFAYDMQTQKRAVLVGEVSGGGANPGGVLPLGPGLMIFMPSGRGENPITKTSWEGRGVSPEIGVPHEDALHVAMQRLGQPSNSGSIEALSQQRVFAPHVIPTSLSEAAARRIIGEVATQQFRYDLMAAPLAAAVRDQIPGLKTEFARWGAVQSVAFREVDPGGADVYDVKFTNGSARLTIVLAADGKALVIDLDPL